MSVNVSFVKPVAANLVGGRVVYVDSNEDLAYSTGPLTASVGVLFADADSGTEGAVITSGVTYVSSSGTINAGSYLVASANGICVAGTGNAAPWNVVGQALSDAVGGLVLANVNPFRAASGSL
jgi:hypothetical protein